MAKYTLTLTDEQNAALLHAVAKAVYPTATAAATAQAYLETLVSDALRPWVRRERDDNPPAVATLKNSIPADLDAEKAAKIDAVLRGEL